MTTPINTKEISIPDKIVDKWQNIVDVLCEITNVPASLIMKVNPPYIDVFRTAKTSKNPYKIGDREHLEGTYYCAKVIKTKNILLVPNALKDSEWKESPDLELGMIAYLGYPLFWPDGEVFGTICVLDAKENAYGEPYEKLILEFKELIEAHLYTLYQKVVEKMNLESILDNLMEGIIALDRKRRIFFFNRAAEEITGYAIQDVIGKDCHEVFEGPFCGSRCVCMDVSPEYLEPISYPINILTANGEPRRLDMSVSPMTDKEGKFIAVLAAFRDITELVGLKFQLKKLMSFAGIIGRDQKMLQVFEQIRGLSINNYPVHISGETGTGKELVASAIHFESQRGGRPFMPINCGALPEGILESELFGHVEGAFSGAIRNKKGRFELADGGTVFLDEITELPLHVQVKLLRVLQDGTFQRVGGEETVSVDVRIISATNKDLAREVKKNNFRDDLYYRLNVVPVHLPPLRERKGDIPLLIEHFLKQAEEEGQKVAIFSKEALSVLMDYHWPGNVRELKNFVHYALFKCRGSVIYPSDLPADLRKRIKARPKRGPSRKLNQDSVSEALARTGGQRTKAAKLLGVGRATLYRFLKDFPDTE